ncbi:hypothetical protein ACRBEV_23950 [Methylobacterium phyllosphaerae]
MAPDPTLSLYATGRTIRRLRAEIEAATGLAFGPARTGAIGAVWGAGSLAGRLLALAGRRRLTVSPGPILSPYDTPETGFASLRISLDGAPSAGRVVSTTSIPGPGTRSTVLPAASGWRGSRPAFPRTTGGWSMSGCPAGSARPSTFSEPDPPGDRSTP